MPVTPTRDINKVVYAAGKIVLHMAGNGPLSVSNRKGKGSSRHGEEQVMSLSSDESFINTAVEDAGIFFFLTVAVSTSLATNHVCYHNE